MVGRTQIQSNKRIKFMKIVIISFYFASDKCNESLECSKFSLDHRLLLLKGLHLKYNQMTVINSIISNSIYVIARIKIKKLSYYTVCSIQLEAANYLQNYALYRRMFQMKIKRDRKQTYFCNFHFDFKVISIST